MRKKIISLSKDTLALKSHEHVCVSSDEITLQKWRDLGYFSNVIAGDQYLPSSSTVPSSAADKDGHTTTDSCADEETRPSPDDTLKSLRKKLKSKWADPMDDIVYINACSLAKEALPKITNVDAQLLHKEHTIQF